MDPNNVMEARRAALMRIFHGAGGGVAGWEAVALWTLKQEAAATTAERDRIIAAVEEEAENTPCTEDAMVALDVAKLIRADFSYEQAEASSAAAEKVDG